MPQTRRDFALFAWAPAVLTIGLALWLARRGQFAVDFRREYWPAGWRVLHGQNLYSWSSTQIHYGIAFPYPALLALLVVPLSLLPIAPASMIDTVACVAALGGSLYLLCVRDWRVFGLCLLTAPVVAAWQTANLTLLLMLMLAIVWRCRDHPRKAGLAAAVLISLKPFVWPALLWLLATRRFTASAWCLAAGLVINAITWSLVGVSQIGDFIHLGQRVSDALFRDGYAIPAVAAHFGISLQVGLLLLAICSALLAAGTLRRGQSSDETSFLACIVLMLVASPLSWNHYFALLILPLAIRRRSLSREWFILLAFWACPAVGVTWWETIIAWALTAALVVASAPRTPSDRIRGGPLLTPEQTASP